MTYANSHSGVFLSRPNRFIAHVELNGVPEICHVKNTGRCRELLIPGAQVFLERAQNPARKTKYDLVAVYKGKRLINMDSQAPNKIFAEWVRAGGFPDVTLVRPEARYGNSRLDFYIEAGGKKIFAEVKGVTLEEDGVALFPDAPTERGVKHLRELISCVREGYAAYAVFVIQMKGIRYFTPNARTHPGFAQALRDARDAGVTLLAFDCSVTPDTITPGDTIPVRLQPSP